MDKAYGKGEKDCSSLTASDAVNLKAPWRDAVELSPIKQGGKGKDKAKTACS